MPRAVGVLSKFTLDLTALRRSRDYRVLELGAIVSGLGTQAALVAVPYQVYVLTHSTALVGLIGAAELGPTVLVSLFGGAIADRVDRRRILLVAQIGTSLSASALAVLAFAGRPPVWLIFVLAALLAASGTLDFIARSSMIAGLAGEWLRSAIAFNFGMNQVTAIVGPGLGGVVIGAAGVGWVYAIDAVSVAATIFAALTIAPQRPHVSGRAEPILASVAAGLRYVRSSNALLGSFVIDLFAMTFGMPRALFVGPLAERVPRRRGRRRTALRLGLGRRGDRRADQRLAGARPLDRADHDRDGGDLGRGDRRNRRGTEPRHRGDPARRRRRRRQHQRGLPHDDRPAGHPRRDARAHDRGLRPRRHRRGAPGRHRVRARRLAELTAVLGAERRPRLLRRRRLRTARLPRPRALRRARPARTR